MRYNKFLFLGFVGVILLLSLSSISMVSAGFSLGNPDYNINNEYDLGEKINGWINISFTDESYNSTFKDSFGNTETLESLLDKNSEYVYEHNTTLNTVNSTFQKLSLNNTFTVQGSLGELEYELDFSDINLFKKTITISTSENLTLKVEAAKALNNKKEEIEDFNEESISYTGFIKEKINVIFNILDFNQKISDLEDLYSEADSSEDYQEILDNLSAIKVPKLITESNSINNLKFYPEKENIDFSVLAGITGEDYLEANKGTYSDGLFVWNQDNIDVRINFKEISASYGFSEEVLFRYFEITFLKKPDVDSYLIIEDIDMLEFGENYNQKQRGKYHYINLGDINYNNIYFTTTENVDFISVPMFISPAMADLPDLGGSDDIIDPEKQMKVSKWVFFGLVLALLLVIALVVYSIVSSWYDRRYENYLFPNRNNLYNLIIYVNNSKRKGIGNDEIVKNLRKSKWSTEQIKYVMKKYAGKRTGMAKLPFQKKIQKPQGPQKPHPSHHPHNRPGMGM